MLGVVFLSEYNELIHAFGNDKFLDHFTSITAKTGHHHQLLENDGASGEYDDTTTAAETTVRPTSSSSSGISSSTSTTCSSPSAATRTEKETERKRSKGGKEENGKSEERNGDFLEEKSWAKQQDEHRRQLDESLLLQQLMPLVLLCRAKQQSQLQQGQKRKGTLSSLNEDVESIFCPNSLLHIRVSCLPHSNLLVLIHGQSIALPSSSSSVADRLFPSLLRCVRYHYGGPSLQLIPLRSAFVRLLSVRCEQRMLCLLSGTENEDDDYALFCQNANFGGPSRFISQSLVPLFRELSRQFSVRIGRRCRCLFLHSNRLIASVASHNGERTVAALRHDDLRSLLQFARQSPPLIDNNEEQWGTNKGKKWARKSHAELGIWLYSKSCRRRQLHNVFVFALKERIEMICATPTEHSQLISIVWEALDSVDKLADNWTEHLPPFSNSEATSLLERCDLLLANEQKFLGFLTNSGTPKRDKAKMSTDFGEESAQQFLLLENIPKTQLLIKQHWSKLREAINLQLSSVYPHAVHSVRPSLCVDRSPSNNRSPSSFLPSLAHLRLPVAVSPRPSVFVPCRIPRLASNNQCTVSSIFSTVEPLTHSSVASSSSSTSFSSLRMSSTLLDAMRLQLRRVQRSLLDELLGWNAFRARAQILPPLQIAVGRSMDSQMVAFLTKLDAELCPNVDIGSRNSLKPTVLGFDMIAYKCVRVGSPSLCLHYVPKENGTQILNKLMFMDDLDTETEQFHDAYGEDEEIEGTNSEEITLARTTEGEMLIRVCHPDNTNAPTGFKSTDRSPVPLPILAALAAPLTSRFGKKSRDFSTGQNANSSTASYRCTVLFSHHTNTSLAIRQTNGLIAKLKTEMEKNIVPNFY